jgi:hypothetical protein
MEHRVMPVAIKGSGGGSVTLDAGAAADVTTLTLPNTTGTILQSGTAVTVAQGGTGASTLTSNAVLIGNGTSAVTAVAPSTNGNVLTSNGTAWTSAAATAPAALSTASGSAPSYSARAWVNFNGTGTVAIRASGNVSSITDNGTGDYTVNFTTAMSDANYTIGGNGSPTGTALCALTLNRNGSSGAEVAPTTSAARINTCNGASTATDVTYANVVIMR